MSTKSQFPWVLLLFYWSYYWLCLHAVNMLKINYIFFSSRVLKYSLCTLKTAIKAILAQYIIPLWMVRTIHQDIKLSYLICSFQPFYQTHLLHFFYHLSGSDGVFDINSTSGCLTLTTYPSLLRNELYEIKVKVMFFFFESPPCYFLGITLTSYKFNLLSLLNVLINVIFKPRRLR